jgi:hypothetical protein
MNKRIRCFCAVAACAGLLLWTCSRKSNPAGPDDGGDDGATETYSYIEIGGTTIRVSIPEIIDTSSYCDALADTLVTSYDTAVAYFRIYSFSISNDTLTLIQNDTAVYARSGTGSDLIGSWIVAGAVAGFPTEMVFTDTTVAVTLADSGNCEADSYIQYQWPFDSADYRLVLNRVSCSQLRLTGDSTLETVTVSWNSGGDMTLTSSSSAHTAHTWYQNPLSCPNNQYPDWYYPEFLNPNARN